MEKEPVPTRNEPWYRLFMYCILIFRKPSVQNSAYGVMGHGGASFIRGFQFHIVSFPAAFFKGSHDFQDMESLAAVRPAAAAAAKGLRHISHTQSAAVILIIKYQRDFFKASFFL